MGMGWVGDGLGWLGDGTPHVFFWGGQIGVAKRKLGAHHGLPRFFLLEASILKPAACRVVWRLGKGHFFFARVANGVEQSNLGEQYLGPPSPGYFSVFPFSGIFPGDPLKTRSFRCFKCRNQKAGVACKRQQ